jgi:hypothetical protein
MYDSYKTTDIILAACLKINDYELDSIKKGESNKGIFIFKNVPKEFVADYDLGKIQVEPVTFNNAIKQLTTSVRRMLQQ